MFKITIIFLLFLSLYAFAENSWNVSLNAYAAQFKKLRNCDSLNVIALTNGSKIYRTTDNGINWKLIVEDSVLYEKPELKQNPKRINDISYISPNIIHACCDTGVILSTSDAGINWVTVNKSKYLHWKHINMFNENIGIIASTNNIYTTHNAWADLDIISSPDFQFLFINDIQIIKTGRIVISAMIYHNDEEKIVLCISDDTCKSFTISNYPNERSGKSFFIDNSVGWLIQFVPDYENFPEAYDVVWFTTNGGETWEMQLNGKFGRPYGLNDIFFYDYSNGYACGNHGKFFYTNNGGRNWTLEPFWDDIIRWPNLTSILATNDNNLFVGSNEKKIYKFSGKFTSNDIIISIHDSIQLRPNPASEYIEINLDRWTPPSRRSPSYIKIYNTLGECVISDVLHLEYVGHLKRIDISQLPPGVYFVRFGGTAAMFVKM